MLVVRLLLQETLPLAKSALAIGCRGCSTKGTLSLLPARGCGLALLSEGGWKRGSESPFSLNTDPECSEHGDVSLWPFQNMRL